MQNSKPGLTRFSGLDGVLAELVEELAERLRNDLGTDVEAFLTEHAEFADRLRPLLPAVALMAELGRSEIGGVGVSSATLTGNGSPGGEDGGHSGGVLGDFRILREIGRGGMGVVYEAEQISLKRKVALKVLPFAAMLDPRHLQRFRNEAQAAAQLHHTNIVPVFAVGSERNVYYYAMQYIDGQTLDQVIKGLASGRRQPAGGVGGGERRQGDKERGRHADTGDEGPVVSVQLTVAANDNGLLTTDRSEIRSDLLPLRKGGPGGSRDIVADAPRRLPAEAGTTNVAARATTSPGKLPREYFQTVAELGIQAAEALDYAHEHGIVHRDIKPSNLILDEEGNLWVTDFGLARIESDSNLTMTGDILGTLRYMSPEQALAKRPLLDHRTDIYSLGVTLYELLTLQPAFPETDRRELLRQIADEDPRHPRSINKSIPVELETIVEKAMAKDADDRYGAAKEVAADLRRHLCDKPITARPASILQRTRKWSRRHKPAVAATAIVLIILGLVGIGLLGDWAARRDRVTALVNSALRDAEREHGKALAAGDDPAAWSLAVASAKRAADLAVAGPTKAALRQQAIAFTEDMRREEARARARSDHAERDRKVLADLDAARLRGSAPGKHNGYDTDGTLEAYAEAFREYGIDLDALSVPESAREIALSRKRHELFMAALEWSQYMTSADPRHVKLLNIAEAVATNEPLWEKPLVAAIRKQDSDELVRMAASLAATLDSPVPCAILATALERRAQIDAGIALLRKARRKYADDFWLNEQLGRILTNRAERSSGSARVSDYDAGVRFLTAAVALRPESAGVHVNLGVALHGKGDLDDAAAEYHRALEINPDYALPHVNIGNLLKKSGDLESAISEYRKALSIDPEFPLARNSLGVALYMKGDLVGSIAEYRRALELNPDFAEAHSNLGNVLQRKGDLDGAIAEYRRAVDLKPDLADVHSSLGNVLERKGDLNGAIAEHHRALKLSPDSTAAHNNLGNALTNKGDLDGAIIEFRRALELTPDDVEVQNNLGIALHHQGDLDGAITWFRRALDQAPKFFQARYNLGHALKENGDLDGAVAEFRRALALAPNDLSTRNSLAQAEHFVKLNARMTAISAGSAHPPSADERAELAEFALVAKHLNALAARWFREAFAEDPRLAEEVKGGPGMIAGRRYNAACAAALASTAPNADGLSTDERSKWRAQSLEWLIAELQALEKLAESAGSQTPDAARFRSQLVATIAHWQGDPDLAGIRDPDRLAALPESERTACEALWRDVKSLLEKLHQPAPADTQTNGPDDAQP